MMPELGARVGRGRLSAESASQPPELSPAILPFEDVYRLYCDRVYRFCLVQLRDPHAAEDIAADVFLTAYNAYERTRPDPDTVHLWLFRIAKNRCINHIRRARRFGRVLNALGRSQQPSIDVEQHASHRSELRLVLDAVASLSTRDRTLVGLRVAIGLSIAEIATTLGMSEAAARSATYRALSRARIAFERCR